MTIKATTPEDYVAQIPEDRKDAFSKLRLIFKENLPSGFQETISYDMIAYVVPHTIYPAGYHCKPSEPLPFISIASQKNNIAIYHMGIYFNEDLLNWFIQEYPKHCKTKLDMGKSCIRIKKIEDIPYQLLAELATKISVEEWINVYESKLKK